MLKQWPTNTFFQLSTFLLQLLQFKKKTLASHYHFRWKFKTHRTHFQGTWAGAKKNLEKSPDSGFYKLPPGLGRRKVQQLKLVLLNEFQISISSVRVFTTVCGVSILPGFWLLGFGFSVFGVRFRVFVATHCQVNSYIYENLFELTFGVSSSRCLNLFGVVWIGTTKSHWMKWRTPQIYLFVTDWLCLTLTLSWLWLLLAFLSILLFDFYQS